MTKLYELTDAYGRLLVLAEEAEDGEWLEALAGLQGAIEEKAENVAKAIRIIQVDAEAFHLEAQRMMAHAATRQRRVESLKQYLLENMEVAGVEKVAGIVPVSIRQSPPACEVDDEAAVPEKYQRVIPARTEIDKRAILEAAKTGIEVAGTRIVRRRYLKVG